MIRRLMILILIILVGYIFYAEFIADSLEPFLRKYWGKPIFNQMSIPRLAVEDN